MHAIAIHGGAGLLQREKYTEEEIEEYQNALKQCLEKGYAVLEKKGTALDAVTASVVALEDCPLFNAGLGSVLTAGGKVQMDASIMCGATERCGAVTLIERIKNPVRAARVMMEHTPHRLLGGREAEALAEKHGLETRENSYFIVPRRLEQLRKAKKAKRMELDHGGGKLPEGSDSNTVGAVALDQRGNLAAATSTGGLTNRLSGRVSDSSIIGAGTYANNATLAISGTGTGDFFIQNVLCFDAHALMSYRGFSLEEACHEVLEKLGRSGGEGGVIALNREGAIAAPFISEGMYRAWRHSEGREEVHCFR